MRTIIFPIKLLLANGTFKFFLARIVSFSVSLHVFRSPKTLAAKVTAVNLNLLQAGMLDFSVFRQAKVNQQKMLFSFK